MNEILNGWVTDYELLGFKPGSWGASVSTVLCRSIVLLKVQSIKMYTISYTIGPWGLIKFKKWVRSTPHTFSPCEKNTLNVQRTYKKCLHCSILFSECAYIFVLCTLKLCHPILKTFGKNRHNWSISIGDSWLYSHLAKDIDQVHRFQGWMQICQLILVPCSPVVRLPLLALVSLLHPWQKKNSL